MIDFFNECFAIVVGCIVLFCVGIFLALLGEKDIAWLVTTTGTLLVLAFALFCIGIGKPRWVSSDWLVDRIVARKMRR